MGRFRWVGCIVAVVAAACGGGGGGGSGPSTRSCPPGQSLQNGSCVAACTSGPVCGGVCCAAGEACTAAGQCAVLAAPGAACGAGLPACGDGLHCLDGACERNDAACIWVPPKGEFAPRVAWQWTEPTDGVRPEFRNVLSTPVVVPLQRQVSDSFAAPAVVFASVTALEGAGVAVNGVLRAVNGRDGTQLWTSDPAHPVNGLAAVAAGDLDGDGFTEFVAAKMPAFVDCVDPGPPARATRCVDPATEGLVAFDHQGRFRWELTLPASIAPAPRVGGRVQWGAPSIANLYGGGEAQIVIGATVVDARGQIVCEGRAGQGNNFLGPVSVVADMDLDGVPEIVTGNTVYGSDCQPKAGWPSMQDATNVWPDGLVAVARFTDDPHPQVVTVSGGRVRLTDWQGDVIWGPVELPHATATLKGGGAPTIGDFDGDGKLEVGVAGDSFYAVFKPFRADGGVNGPAASILWRKPTQDDSAVTGSSVFDFQDDGAAEVVYGDECYTRVFDGQSGATVFESPNPSCTVHESPVIADVNRDGRAELVVATNTVCNAAGAGEKVCPWGRHADHPEMHGITVFKDLRDRWVSTRPVWNQHAYHVTNVGDDGSIPLREQPHYATPATNNFRMNSMGEVDYSAPDLAFEAGRDVAVATSTCPAALTVRVRVWNRGAALVAPGVPVAVYAGAAGPPVALGHTAGAIVPGQSETVVLAVSPAPAAPTDLRVVVNDDGSGQGIVGECRAENNAAVIPGVLCPPSSQ